MPTLEQLAEQDKLVQAQIKLLTSQNSLTALQKQAAIDQQKAIDDKAKQVADAAKAADDARLKQITDLAASITKFSTSANLPKGDWKVSSDLIATPTSSALALKGLDEIADDIVTSITGLVGNKTIILSKDVPGSDAHMELPYHLGLSQRLNDQIIETAVWLKKQGFDTKILPTELMDSLITPPARGKMTSLVATSKSLALAAAIIPAIPDLVNAIGGMFRVDRTEKTGTAGTVDSSLESLVLGKLQSPTTTTFVSIDTYAHSRMTDVSSLELVQNIEAMLIRKRFLDEGIFNLDQIIAELGLTKTNSDANLKALGEKKAKYEDRIDAIEVELTKATADAAISLNKEKALLEARTAALKNDLKSAGEANRATVLLQSRSTAVEAKLKALSESVKSYTTDISTEKNGKTPLLELIKDELLLDSVFPGNTGMRADRAASSPVRLLTLKIVSQPMSIVETKSFFITSYTATALISVEYRLCTTAGAIDKCGFIHRAFAWRIPKLSAKLGSPALKL